ncbi:MAG: hypothetical protein BWX90_00765 [bacterium ADurb.Bin132]|nr:MAG: hypothetical protein BWX90_00765 [bacterium ADurb.Bin132]
MSFDLSFVTINPPGEITHGVDAAILAFICPAPCNRKLEYSPVVGLIRSFDVFIRASLVSDGVQSGLACFINATAPDTIPALAEVPEKFCVYFEVFPSAELVERGAGTPIPGAQTSGLNVRSDVGPIAVILATVSAFSSVTEALTSWLETSF